MSVDENRVLKSNPKEVREVSKEAVWTVSSCKAGYGVEQLLDNNTETYWQSDGPQPHLVNIQFRRKTTLLSLAMFVDFKADESYTPTRIAIRIGSNISDLREVRQIELPNEPTGWQTLKFGEDGKPARAFMIQVAILQNHQNGRDTHIRQMKVFSPTATEDRNRVQVTNPHSHTLYVPEKFTSIEFLQHQTLR